MCVRVIFWWMMNTPCPVHFCVLSFDEWWILIALSIFCYGWWQTLVLYCIGHSVCHTSLITNALAALLCGLVCIVLGVSTTQCGPSHNCKQLLCVFVHSCITCQISWSCNVTLASGDSHIRGLGQQSSPTTTCCSTSQQPSLLCAPHEPVQFSHHSYELREQVR